MFTGFRARAHTHDTHARAAHQPTHTLIGGSQTVTKFPHPTPHPPTQPTPRLTPKTTSTKSNNNNKNKQTNNNNYYYNKEQTNKNGQPGVGASLSVNGLNKPDIFTKSEGVQNDSARSGLRTHEVSVSTFTLTSGLEEL